MSSSIGAHADEQNKNRGYMQKNNSYNQIYHSMPKANIPIEPCPGVGDEASVKLWNVVTARSGHFAIVIDLRYYHDSDELTKMLALSRLRDKKSDSTARLNEPFSEP